MVAQQPHTDGSNEGERKAGDEQWRMPDVTGERTESRDDGIDGGRDQHDHRGAEVDANPGEHRTSKQQQHGGDGSDYGHDQSAAPLQDEGDGTEGQQQSGDGQRGHPRVVGGPAPTESLDRVRNGLDDVVVDLLLLGLGTGHQGEDRSVVHALGEEAGIHVESPAPRRDQGIAAIGLVCVE